MYDVSNAPDDVFAAISQTLHWEKICFMSVCACNARKWNFVTARNARDRQPIVINYNTKNTRYATSNAFSVSYSSTNYEMH